MEHKDPVLGVGGGGGGVSTTGPFKLMCTVYMALKRFRLGAHKIEVLLTQNQMGLISELKMGSHNLCQAKLSLQNKSFILVQCFCFCVRVAVDGTGEGRGKLL